MTSIVSEVNQLEEQKISKYSFFIQYVEDSGKPIFFEAFEWTDVDKIEREIWDLVNVDNEIDNKIHQIKKIKKNNFLDGKLNLSFDDMMKISTLKSEISDLNVIYTDLKIDEKTGRIVKNEEITNSEMYRRIEGKEASEIRKQFYIQLYNEFNYMDDTEFSALSPARPRKSSNDGSVSSNDSNKETSKKLKKTVKNVMNMNNVLKKAFNWRQYSKDKLTSLYDGDNSKSSQDSNESDYMKRPTKKNKKVGFGNINKLNFKYGDAPSDIKRTLSMGSESRELFDSESDDEDYEEKDIRSIASQASDKTEEFFRDIDFQLHFPSASPFPIHPKTDIERNWGDNDKFMLPESSTFKAVDDFNNNYKFNIKSFNGKTSPTESIIHNSPSSSRVIEPSTVKRTVKRTVKPRNRKLSVFKPTGLNFPYKKRKMEEIEEIEGGKKKKTRRKKKKRREKKKTRRKR